MGHEQRLQIGTGAPDLRCHVGMAVGTSHLVAKHLSEAGAVRTQGVVRDIVNFASSQFAGNQQHVGDGVNGRPDPLSLNKAVCLSPKGADDCWTILEVFPASEIARHTASCSSISRSARLKSGKGLSVGKVPKLYRD
jgi:hypothetical protein